MPDYFVPGGRAQAIRLGRFDEEGAAITEHRSAEGPVAVGATTWEPVTVEALDKIGAGPLRRLAALLDSDAPQLRDVVPPLGHWLYFLPEDRQSDLGEDGHPRRGALLPPIAAPRRMWAGGRIDFVADLPVGVTATKRSKVVGVEEKRGRTGTLTFVTVRHEILVSGRLAIIETQDLVYREATPAAAPPPTANLRPATATRRLTADSRTLFRYSALTNNAHRIHYDRGYATGVEGYRGLVVHGPFQATLLVDHLRRARPGARLARFAFRGVRPLFDGEPFELNLADGVDEIELWTRDAVGATCMEATAVLR